MTRYEVIWQHLVAQGAYELLQLRDEAGAMELRLGCADGGTLALKFESALAYRKCDEGDALRTLEEIRQFGDLKRAFHEAHGSEFLAWFIDQTLGVRRAENLRHFVILTLNDVVEVIALSDPTITRAD